MPFTGDVKVIGNLARNLRKLGDVPSRIAKRVADGITEELEHQFDTGTDPYGNAWAAIADATLRRRSYSKSRIPLTDSGAMAAKTYAKPLPGKGVAVVVAAPGAIHQTGSKFMPARKILPDRGLPEIWKRIIDDAARDAFREALR